MFRHLWKRSRLLINTRIHYFPDYLASIDPNKLCRSLCVTTNNMATEKPKPRVYVTRRIPEPAIEILKAECDITQWNDDMAVPRDTLLEKVQGIDGLYCLLTDKIDKAVIETAGPALKVISTMSVGYEHIDVGYCKEKNIPIGYTPDVLTDATAELTVALLLATSRRIVEGSQAVRSGEWGTWKPMWMCGAGLTGATVGVFGFGRIGIAVAQRLKPFGVQHLLYTNSNRKEDVEKELGAVQVPLEELLERSDFLVVSCSFRPENKEMFNRNLFSKMKKSCIFVNTSRGGLVDQEGLLWALSNGIIRGAGLDVTTPEPLPTDHPLLSLPNCVVLPHIGSATDSTRTEMATLAARNLLAALAGRDMPARVVVA